MKLKTCVPETSLYAKGWGIIFQTVLIFFFLTIFFFVYVSQVEKVEFKKQMDIIVDDLARDVNVKIPENMKEDTYILVNGVLDYEEENIKIKSEPEIIKIKNSNKKVVTKSVNSLVIVGIIVVVGLMTLFFFGYCFPIKKHVIDSFIAVLVVGTTELFFLLVIAKNYISANPQEFRQNLGKAIITYVNTRK